MLDGDCQYVHDTSSGDKRSNGNTQNDADKFFLYCWLDPRNPERARRRIGDIYWSAWSAFVLGFFLSGIGVTLLVLGAVCVLLAMDYQRGCALFIAGCMVSIPGLYSLMVLWFYVCGRKGYSYTQLLRD
ncbi:hypothetical protein DQ04_00271090 [Trypanosoma grayi]|uniref:hypothetical protein n=1 Tax=Trypanosoma grayi TaxID=71804 RepID=UPI0004F41388|nr:hypothetical protein DQ04_00271090 [Trypanosoma grayi]KEG14875.1 hypothetical protein DQ04_00271090 [Trypanosoma grayi]